MTIRRSSSVEIQQLIADLERPEEVDRESAIARLAVLGRRAAEHLLNAYPTVSIARTRIGMLRALEACGDSRVLPLARDALRDPSPDVGSAAIAVLRSLLTASPPDVARDALDALVALALDRVSSVELRMAVFEALRELPSSTIEPIRRTLADDPDPAIRHHTAAKAVPADASEPAVWARALEAQLPGRPDLLRKAIAVCAASARLTELQRLVDLVRAEETRERDPERCSDWRMARGALHQALAARGSRLALYDLRDSLLEADRLPVAFLAALEEVGDASCLEPLAAAYDASSSGSDPWWRDHLAAAFRAIVRREGLTRRHSVVRRAMTRWPEAAAELMARS
jgi:hypothetical protein